MCGSYYGYLEECMHTSNHRPLQITGPGLELGIDNGGDSA